MTKFTAAINILKELNGPTDTITENGKYDDAIRILSAAEKIPAQQVLSALESIPTPNSSNQNVVYNGLIDFMRTLIESLPEEK